MNERRASGRHRKVKAKAGGKAKATRTPEQKRLASAKPGRAAEATSKPQSSRQAVRELHASEKKRASRAKKGLEPEPVIAPQAAPPPRTKKSRKPKAPPEAPTSRRESPRRRAVSAKPQILAQEAFRDRHAKPSGRIRRRRWVVGTLIGILAIVALLGSLYYFTGIFYVKEIEVTGCNHLNPDYIRALSGISTETRFFGVNGGEVEKALKSEFWVESVTIKRKLPLKLILQVKERTPWASVTMIGRLFSVDSSGIVLEELPAPDPALPMILGLSSRPVTPGDSVDDEIFATCRGVLQSLPQALHARFASLASTPSREVTLVTLEGMQIIYGTPTDEQTKNEAIRALLQDPAVDLAGLEYLDVSVPDHPVIKPR